MGDINKDLEYRKRWEYVVQSEERRDRTARWYFVLAGALLGVVYTGRLDPELPLARPVVLTFLTLYSLAMIAYLVSLKLSYREHVKRIRQLDKVGTEHRDNGGGAYSIYIYSLGLVAAFLAFATVVEFARAESEGAAADLAWCEAGFAAIVVFVVVAVYNVYRLRCSSG